MLKKILLRVVVTAPLCMVVSQIISVIVSYCLGNGQFFPINPEFAALFPSMAIAVIAQSLLVGLVGATFAACSIIYELEHWSYLKQGLVHLSITSTVLMPVCLICWRPINQIGIWILISSWTFTYFCTWLPRYFIWRHNIRVLNEKIKSANGKEPS